MSSLRTLTRTSATEWCLHDPDTERSYQIFAPAGAAEADVWRAWHEARGLPVPPLSPPREAPFQPPPRAIHKVHKPMFTTSQDDVT